MKYPAKGYIYGISRFSMFKNKSGIRMMFSLSFFVLLLSSVASYFSISELTDSEKWVRHTYAVIEKLDSVVSRMKDAETGYRGYLITGNKVFLEPYIGSKEQTLNALEGARVLTENNATQQEEFPKLHSLITEKYRLAESWIAERSKRPGYSEDRMLYGKSVMDSIRTVVATMKARELVLMDQRQLKNTKFTLYTPLFVMVGAILGIALTIFFYIRLKQDLKRNELLQAELEYVEKDRNRQIGIIERMAKKVAGGDYSARIDLNRLAEDGDSGER